MFLHDLLLFTGRRDPQHGGPSRFGRSALQAATGLRFHSTRAAASCGPRGNGEKADLHGAFARASCGPRGNGKDANAGLRPVCRGARDGARGRSLGRFRTVPAAAYAGAAVLVFLLLSRRARGGPKGCGNRDPEKYLCAARGGKAAKLKAQGGPFPHLCTARGGKATLTGVTRGFEYHLCAARGGKAGRRRTKSAPALIYAPRAGARLMLAST